MTKDGMILHVPAEQMALGHRLSSFMQTGEIILSVKMQLTQGNPVVIKAAKTMTKRHLLCRHM